MSTLSIVVLVSSTGGLWLEEEPPVGWQGCPDGNVAWRSGKRLCLEGANPGGNAFLGTPTSFPEPGTGMLTVISHGGGLHRSLMRGRQVTFLMA